MYYKKDQRLGIRLLECLSSRQEVLGSILALYQKELKKKEKENVQARHTTVISALRRMRQKDDSSNLQYKASLDDSQTPNPA